MLLLLSLYLSLDSYLANNSVLLLITTVSRESTYLKTVTGFVPVVLDIFNSVDFVPKKLIF